jgi:hypothetical protein
MFVCTQIIFTQNLKNYILFLQCPRPSLKIRSEQSFCHCRLPGVRRLTRRHQGLHVLLRSRIQDSRGMALECGDRHNQAFLLHSCSHRRFSSIPEAIAAAPVVRTTKASNGLSGRRPNFCRSSLLGLLQNQKQAISISANGQGQRKLVSPIIQGTKNICRQDANALAISRPEGFASYVARQIQPCR